VLFRSPLQTQDYTFQFYINRHIVKFADKNLSVVVVVCCGGVILWLWWCGGCGYSGGDSSIST
jgi:hypothetical protein